uniref:uncharacterized protein LOC122579126 n=1 Tax=Erigeron canadensis TaxID=72917 RepID=UPI001CB99CE8|nr:uncharacterized protein LOC122579126 [Erigeron canadensis]
MKASKPDVKQENEKMNQTASTTGQTQQEQRVVEASQQPQPPTNTAPIANTKGVATSGAILENAAASVSSALQSAREVISKN